MMNISALNVNRCYDCRDICTKDYYLMTVQSEDGNRMRVPIHRECYERAVHGGVPIYPERKLKCD